MEQQEYMMTSNKSRVKQEVISSLYTIKFDDDIKDPFLYDDEMEVFEKASPNDQVLLKINTNGGDASSLAMILDGMKNCQAPIFGKIVGKAHSAGSFMAMHCDELEVVDGSGMIVHTIQTGWIDNAGGMKKYSDHVYSQAEGLIRDAYTGFLTEEEIKEVLSGVELPFNAQEIRERWVNRQEYLSSSQEPITDEEKQMYLPLVLQQFVDQADALDMTVEELLEFVTENLMYEDEEPLDVLEIVENSKDLNELKNLAKNWEINFAHNIGIESLRKKLLEFLNK